MGGEEQVLEATEEACRVYVGNLLPKAKERHLTSKFARFGTIHSVWIARKPPGFAFVRFAARDAAQRAVEACGEDGVMEILGKANPVIPTTHILRMYGAVHFQIGSSQIFAAGLQVLYAQNIIHGPLK
ncbi:hypothetical protein KRP22_013705 [Phytophthora ramorum]|nr:RNA-binding protein Rsf1 [Phytophthora ramorum]